MSNCNQTICVLLICMTMLGFTSPSICHAEEIPLRLEPQILANEVPEPERSMRIGMAEMVREQQSKALGAAVDSDTWQQNFLTGIGFALEEYWTLELSFPETIDQLRISGYLLDGWQANGFTISGFDDFNANPNHTQLVYLPTPLGISQVKSVPGRHCAFRRRCFVTYSLLILQTDMPEWGIEEGLNTHWVEPFLKHGFVEIMHLNKDNPGMSGCATCD